MHTPLQATPLAITPVASLLTAPQEELVGELALQLLRRDILLAVGGVDDLQAPAVHQRLHQLPRDACERASERTNERKRTNERTNERTNALDAL
jgi:hypothetical protein